MITDPKVIERFVPKYIKNLSTQCWDWQAQKDKDGYGVFSFNQRPIQAHRASFLIYKGDIPRKFLVCHHCDNPSCVNPEHLFLGTNSDNMQDMLNKGRGNYAKGSTIGVSKLTEKGVIFIRASTLSSRELSQKFKVSYPHICLIRQGKTWKHLL